MRTVLVNLSNQAFAASRTRLNESARRHGIDEIRSWDFEEIRATDFYRSHRAILEQPRGMGYWLWKPYILLDALRVLSDGDLAIYCDSGIEIIAPLDPLLRICREDEPLVLFGNGNFTNAAWTKRDCFIRMDCDNAFYWEGPQCDAAFLLVRKCPASLNFLEEWLRYASDEQILTDRPNISGKRNLPDFVEHRHDQSILSLLAQRFRIPLYRIPTQFGNHYKTYPYRLANEFNVVNQYRQTRVDYYAAIPYYNSPYHQLLDHHRQNTTAAGGQKASGPGLLPRFRRIVLKRYNRLLNQVSLWRE